MFESASIFKTPLKPPQGDNPDFEILGKVPRN